MLDGIDPIITDAHTSRVAQIQPVGGEAIADFLYAAILTRKHKGIWILLATGRDGRCRWGGAKLGGFADMDV